MKRTEGIVCLVALYLLWGSTYLGIRLAVETIPPMIAAMARHGFGGLALMLGLFVFGGWTKPSSRQCLNALKVGALTVGIANGSLMWAEVHVPSAYAAIAFSTMPLFMLILNWFSFEKVRPSKFDLFALPAGLLGTALVITAGKALSGSQIRPFDAALLLLCPSVWALGSLLGRKWAMPKSILTSSALQMLGGTLLLAALSVFHREWSVFDINAVSQRSFWGFLYLAIGGSLLGYTVFALAIRDLDPRVVGTFAFICPLIAVALGYFAGETVTTPPVVAGALLAIASVILTFIGARFRSKDALAQKYSG